MPVPLLRVAAEYGGKFMSDGLRDAFGFTKGGGVAASPNEGEVEGAAAAAAGVGADKRPGGAAAPTTPRLSEPPGKRKGQSVISYTSNITC